MWAFDPSVRLGELPSKVCFKCGCEWEGVRVGGCTGGYGHASMWACGHEWVWLCAWVGAFLHTCALGHLNAVRICTHCPASCV
jgi:hypothetical protein